MTGNHRDTTISRRRALAVTGGTADAGGLAVAGYRTAFADEATTTATADATASATASESSGTCVLMSSVTEGPYYLDNALVRKDRSCAPVAGAAVEIRHCDDWGYYSGYTTANRPCGLSGREPVQSRAPNGLGRSPRGGTPSPGRSRSRVGDTRPAPAESEGGSTADDSTCPRPERRRSGRKCLTVRHGLLVRYGHEQP